MQKSNERSAISAPCAAAGEEMSAYLDGELSDEERERLEAHLNECLECAALCDALRTLRGELALTALEPPADLRGRIMSRVRREQRMRRLRRLTAVGAVGAAACFCLVSVGVSLHGVLNRADNMARDPGVLRAGNAFYDGADANGCDDYAQMPEMTAAFFDTTLEADQIAAGTGLLSDTASLDTQSAPEADGTTPAVNSVLPTYASSLPCGVRAVILPEYARSLALLGSGGHLTTFSGDGTGKAEQKQPDASDQRPDTPRLSELIDDPFASLCEEQVGQLCTVRLDDGGAGKVYVFDLTTGSCLSLTDFVGGDALEALSNTLYAVSGLQAELNAETAYFPTGAGLALLLPETVETEVILPWDASEELTACVERYAMTELPLCAPEGSVQVD